MGRRVTRSRQAPSTTRGGYLGYYQQEKNAHAASTQAESQVFPDPVGLDARTRRERRPRRPDGQTPRAHRPVRAHGGRAAARGQGARATEHQRLRRQASRSRRPIHLVGIEFSRESRRAGRRPRAQRLSDGQPLKTVACAFIFADSHGQIALAPQAQPSTKNAEFVPKQYTERLVFDLAKRLDGAYPSWYSAKR
jgi:hypothetical protein